MAEDKQQSQTKPDTKPYWRAAALVMGLIAPFVLYGALEQGNVFIPILCFAFIVLSMMVTIVTT